MPSLLRISFALLVAGTCLCSPGAAVAASSDAVAWGMIQRTPAHDGTAVGATVAPPLKSAWFASAGTPGRRGASGPVVVGDLVISVGREAVFAVDAATGSVSWTVARAPDQPITPALTEDGQTLVYPEGSTDQTAGVVGLDLGDRSVRWRFATDGPVHTAPAVAGGAAFVGSDKGTVYAIDTADGRKRWSFEAGGRVNTAPAVAGGLVYVVSEDLDTRQATVYALHEQDGKEAWRYDPPGPNVFCSALAVSGDRAFVGLGDGSVRAVSAASGVELWKVRTGAVFSPLTVPALIEGDPLLTDAAGALLRLDGQTGRREWEFRFPSAFVRGSPLVVGTAVFAGRDDGVLVAVDAGSGRQLWEGSAGKGPIGSLAAVGARLYAGVGAGRGGVAALERDPSGTVTSIESPSVLHLLPALLNYLLALLAVAGVLLLAFRVLGRPRTGSADADEGPPQVEGLR